MESAKLAKTPRTIFEYDDFREFLRDAYATSKARNKNFSFRFFSRVAGFKSSNVLKQVIDGKRNIAVSSIDKFAKALKLNKEETQFFRSLVQFNQSKTADERQTFAEEIIRSRLYKKMHPLSENQYNCYAHWYFLPVRELVGLHGFQNQPEKMAKKMRPQISTADFEKALGALLELGLIHRDEKGRLAQTNLNISTTDEVASASVARFHRDMMARASESIDLIAREERELSSVTMGMSVETAKKIKDMLQKFRKEIVEVVSRDPAPDTVYQLNFQLFPLSETLGEKEK